MSRWALIATLSLAVNAAAWGAFGHLLSVGARPLVEPPMELTLTPELEEARPRQEPEPPRVEPPRAEPPRAEPPRAEPPPLCPPPDTDCATKTVSVTQVRPSKRPLAARPPEEREPETRAEPETQPERSRTSPEPASEKQPQAAALPRAPGGDWPQARASHEGAREKTGPGASAASLPRPEAPGIDRVAIAGRIYAALQRHRRYPRLARLRGIEGTVLLSFRVTRSGMVEQPRILRSGGALLDEAALDALRKAAPLPYYPGPIRVPVVFALED